MGEIYGHFLLLFVVESLWLVKEEGLKKGGDVAWCFRIKHFQAVEIFQ